MYVTVHHTAIVPALLAVVAVITVLKLLTE